MKNALLFTALFVCKIICCQTNATYTGVGDYVWVAPPGVTTVMVDVWGTGGNGGYGTGFFGYGASGGGGGGYSRKNTLSVIPGNSYAVHIGAAGGTTYFVDALTVLANCGTNGTIGPVPDPMPGGIGGSTIGAVGDIKTAGGNGGIWSNLYGAGGSGGGSAGLGGNGGAGNPATSFGAPGTGGSAGGALPAGVTGAVGVGFGSDGTAGSVPGGGGSGAANFGLAGGAGGSGQVIITYLTVLPVTWNDLSAECNNGTAFIQWSTASETNNDFFTIERTLDGIIWQTLSTVNGSGSSSIQLDYSYTDENTPSGFCYYRIKQTDYNGQYDYSEIILLNTSDCSGSDYSIISSPASPGSYIIQGLSADETIVVYSVSGQKISDCIFDTADQTQGCKTVNLTNQSSGIYLITIISKDQVSTLKLLK